MSSSSASPVIVTRRKSQTPQSSKDQPSSSEAPAGVHKKFVDFRHRLETAMVERSGEIQDVLTALVAGENILLVGPPGTGKSMLADALVEWIDGKKFCYLLTKYTTPDEVFGPLSIKSLKEDNYRRITTGRLPEADVIFLDEIWKASSAILNALLKALNEGTYQNGNTEMKCPALVTIAASNEWPTDRQELGALFDRFLIRRRVRPVSTFDGLDRLVFGDTEPETGEKITVEDVVSARFNSMRVEWTEESKQAFWKIVSALRKEGIFPGDRRLKKSGDVAKAAAWLDGSTEVEPCHLKSLENVLWNDPEQAEKASGIIRVIADPMGSRINSLLGEAEELLSKVDPEDLNSAAACMKKLGGINTKLSQLGSRSASDAMEYVKQEIKRVREASLGKLG